jgi:argininosuccinate lyase
MSNMSNKMWGGRFVNAPSEIMEEINASIEFDRRLHKYDIAGSKAHCQMLAATGIISEDEAEQIIAGLDKVMAEIEAGKFEFSRAMEDIHMNIEARLLEIAGPVAGKLHTARSRNDQVATDFKLYIRETVDHLAEQLRDLQRVMAEKAQENAATVMPGFTHLQTAQPVTFGHHLLAYVEMFARDRARFIDARARLNECPLGAAALAGTSFPIDRHMTAEELEFAAPSANSLDAVSDRDFVLETLAASAICAMHLSRLSEEILIWSSSEFGFITLSDAFTTGSSIMPQKRNPDAAELTRAKAGRIAAAFHGLLMVMKGLPLAYSKDMQEDKEMAFDALDNLSLMLAAMTGMIADMQPDKRKMRLGAGRGYSTATDLADWLVRVLGMPFRNAHHTTGKIVARAEKLKKPLHLVPLEDMQAVEPRINENVFKVLTVANSVKSRESYGGSAPKNVRKMAKRWINKLQ